MKIKDLKNTNTLKYYDYGDDHDECIAVPGSGKDIRVRKSEGETFTLKVGFDNGCNQAYVIYI